MSLCNVAKCCCCLPLRTGVILMSLVVLAELILAGLTLLDRDLPLHIFDIPNCVLKLLLFACFIWNILQPSNLKAR